MARELVDCGLVVDDGVRTRRMSSRERAAWNLALWVVVKCHDRDTAEDALARHANDAEEASVKAEIAGRHKDAINLWRVSELYDVAAKALI